MSQTVIDYVLSRLKQLGIKDVFGVPGDYSFGISDAICTDPLAVVGMDGQVPPALTHFIRAQPQNLAGTRITPGRLTDAPSARAG